ncbi:GAF domain-containing protein [Rhizobium halophytocola]|uniref:Blue-light-activated histidine kinase n=1 Tax=Rhizobium halophytocola TaxID=735519 RepID=A0ABS4E5K7_9HYPH|nr:GAF domain-containing protein [Rhizobium halophytocola]MBP1853227.1 PAS domain S-box-containing protein [Rhizobium halophytocola]
MIELVCRTLDCPVSLISILQRDRQVFAAHVGLPDEWAARGETPLTHSFCQHVVSQRTPLIVDDATVHQLVQDNLAIRDLGVIAYLGVPVSLPDGTVIGALAAIDVKKRHWSETDIELLSRFGRVVTTQIATYVSEHRWKSIVEDLQEGLIAGRVRRSDDGSIGSIAYEAINPAGRRLAAMLSGDGEAWRADIATCLQTGDPVRFTRQIETAWYAGHIQSVGPDSFLITLIDISERMAAEEALRHSEGRLRLLFDGAKDYAIIIIAPDMSISGWLGGAPEVFGRSHETMIGRPFADIFLEEDRQAGVPEKEIANAERSGVALDRRWHRHFDGSPIFLDGTVRPLPREPGAPSAGYIKIARNATSEKLAADRQMAFLELGDRMRDLSTVEEVTFAAAEIIARTLTGVSRAGYGVVDSKAETVDVVCDWRAEGVASMQGVHNFRDFGSFIDDLKRGESVVIPDVVTDSRTRDSAELMRANSIRVLVNMPIMEHGALVGLMFVHYDKPQRFTGEESNFVRTIADRAREALARVRAEEEQEILNREISHRLKNSMAMVQAIATQTLRKIPDRATVDSFHQRLNAFSRAHEVLLQRNWMPAPLIEVINAVLGQISVPERYVIDGPRVQLGARTALTFSLILHELGTNAAKYGAWSNGEGRVTVRWRIEREADGPVLVFEWCEEGGPPVTAPTAKGFGSRLIQTGLLGNGGVEIDYLPAGLRLVMRGSLAQLREA